MTVNVCFKREIEGRRSKLLHISILLEASRTRMMADERSVKFTLFLASVLAPPSSRTFMTEI